MISSFKKSDVLAACQRYGPQLRVPPGVDPVKLMTAIASNESNLGEDCGPRYEKSYDIGGRNYLASKAQQLLVARFGRPACCSYGPWQMMFDNFMTEDPWVLETQLMVNAQEFVRFYNTYVAGHWKPVNLEQIGDVWNLGHIGPDTAYTNKLAVAYEQAAGTEIAGGNNAEAGSVQSSQETGERNGTGPSIGADSARTG